MFFELKEKNSYEMRYEHGVSIKIMSRNIDYLQIPEQSFDKLIERIEKALKIPRQEASKDSSKTMCR
jgi:hypothetical protein